MSESVWMTPDDVAAFQAGRHFRLYDRFGSRALSKDGLGSQFRVYAPGAAEVSVVGPFNDWVPGRDPLEWRPESGTWEGRAPGASEGALYKYHLVSRYDGYRVDKADPFGFRHETPPRTASIVWNLDFEWSDREWMASRADRQRPNRPISIYEVHLGSWRRALDGRLLSYGEMAEQLADYVCDTGFTHVELLPVMEHPFTGSWGYQTTGYFAPTSRFGAPQDFMRFVDHLHGRGVGVILDWVPSHFPSDEAGLGFFDGTHLYEHADPRQGFHPDWKSCIFNYGKNEVRSFLGSSALFWLDRYHADGIRVDAVASMLYLDYSRPHGEWVANEHGGRENLAAIGFLRDLADAVHGEHPGALLIAEESTSWPGVTRSTASGGLGFDWKWDLGWMNDTLKYMGRDPVHRKFHHDELTFRMMYAFSESFVLPLSHDEVVHGKRSLLGRMPGDEWQRFASLRVLFALMFAEPGKKLLFMGDELGEEREWNHDGALDWEMALRPLSEGVRRWIRDLNGLYRARPALHESDADPAGFSWIDCHDTEQSVVTLLRSSLDGRNHVAVALNFTPIIRERYRIGVSAAGGWIEILNSDAREYGGSGVGNLGRCEARPEPAFGRPASMEIVLPPLSGVFFVPDSAAGESRG